MIGNLKMIFIYLISIFILMYLSIGIFIRTSPAFGRQLTKEQIQEFEKLDNFENGVFINQIPTDMDMGFKNGMATLWEFFKGGKGRKPDRKLPVEKMDLNEISQNKGKTNRVTWFGHSSFLLEIDGKIILIDPMFSRATSPVQLLGPKRYTQEFPIELKDLPKIDVVLISHDHYDHLDEKSIKHLKSITKQFIVPLAVGNHLKKWKVDSAKIIELNWWENFDFGNIKFTSTPARHFSGRGPTDRSKTLWCSWVIQSENYQIFFSGDTGYGPHFKQIHDNFGEFDLALMECGQYNEKWKNIHMLPEQTVQAAIEIGAKIFMPIHWAGYTLSLHSWTEPVERAIKEANKLNIPITTPKIGESINLDNEIFPRTNWWEK